MRSSQSRGRRPPAALLIVCALSPAAAVAQTGNSNALEEIVVEATRLSRTLGSMPSAVTVIGEDEIQLGRQQLGLDEALTRVPGLFMQNRYNFSRDLRISIRGFGARADFGIRGVKILVDGIPETLPDGSGQVDSIDLGATRSIEVIRGPSSAIYGNASGGVISVTSEDGPEDPYLSTRLLAGEFGFSKVQLKAGGQTDNMNYLVSLSDMELDGYRQQSRFENTQFSGRFRFDLGNDSSFLAVVNHTDQPMAQDPGGINAAQAAADPRSARDRNVDFDTGETMEQTRLGFVYTTPIGDNGELAARSYFVSRDFTNKLPQFPVADAVDLPRDFAGVGLSYSHEGTWNGRANRLIVGFDMDDQDDNRKRFINNRGVLEDLIFDQNESFESRGVFLQNELSVSDDLLLTLGIRFDQVDYTVTDRFLDDGDDSGARSMDDVSPMAGISYALSQQLSLFGTVSTGFETPSTTDFANPTGGGGFNQALDPQTATNYEVGLRGTLGERHFLEASVFTVDVEDELVPSDFDGRDFFQNAGTSNRSGIELSLISNFSERVRTSLAVSYGQFEFDDFRIVSFDAGGTPTISDDFSGNNIPGTVEQL
ncbi:MAG TPA: TonB-dependent receptor, partial [Gammaproteobacteria bacterium]